MKFRSSIAFLYTATHSVLKTATTRAYSYTGPSLSRCSGSSTLLSSSWVQSRSSLPSTTPSQYNAGQTQPFSNTALHAKRQSKRRKSSLEKEEMGTETASDNSAAAAAARAVVSETTASFATDYHAPVMCVECVDALLTEYDYKIGKNRYKEVSKNRVDDPTDHQAATTATESGNHRPRRIFVDGTLGGGGHSLALLQRLEAGDIVFGCDLDSDALLTASERLKDYTNHTGREGPLFVPVQSNFCDLRKTLPNVLHPYTQEPLITSNTDGFVDGLLLDLGVSSYQLDTAERGFAFMKEGPLDMRMDSESGGMTAADICNELGEQELKQMLKKYGDEQRARSISRSIVERRPLVMTQDLVDAVSAVVPPFAKKGRRMGRQATLARVFQSFRIVVNREDESLRKALEEMAPTLVKTGGRLVILSYHSLEDRASKRVLRDGVIERKEFHLKRDIYGNILSGPKRPWKTTVKRQSASKEEIELNPRARSATMRVGVRVADKENLKP